MEGIFEFKNLPKGIKVPNKLKIKNVDDVSKLGIKKGDTLHIKGLGDFRVTFFVVGTRTLWLDVE